MKRFVAIALVCALFAVMLASNLKAQSPSQNSAAQPVANATAQAQASPASAPEAEVLPSGSPPALFYIGPSPDKNVPSIFSSWWPAAIALPISNSIVCSWIIALIIIIVVRVTTWKNIKEIPSGMQNVIEMIVESWNNFMKDVLDERVARWVFPYATTFLIFIFLCNYVDLVPGVDTIGVGTPVKDSIMPFSVENINRPFFRPPTTDANLTVAMTLVFLVMSMFWAIRYNGLWGFTKHVFGVKMKVGKMVLPLIALLFLFIGAMELVSILFARPVALAMRLFGNIFAGQTMFAMGFHLHSWLGTLGITIIIYFYETFVCAVQAFVFALLVVAFVGTMCSHQEEEGH
ncbi:MAG TPA: F0F1 ATP synthase subunit A [Verrucomicrobiae bacterium]